jgi:hypothetical protein
LIVSDVLTEIQPSGSTANRKETVVTRVAPYNFGLDKNGSFENAVGNVAHEACGLSAEKSSLPAMRNSTVRMVLKLAYPRALRLAA